MISVSEARRIIREHTFPLPPSRLPLLQASGLALASDVHAPVPVPAFLQSSMDGYAFAHEGWNPSEPLPVSGTIAAGEAGQTPLVPGTAVRIFTGAPLPPGADTVVMQEKTRVEGGQLWIDDPTLGRGAYVRLPGSEISKDALALPVRAILNPPALGFLAHLGIAEVTVFPRPRTSLVVTGNELQTPGMALGPGQVYEAGSFALSAALGTLDMHPVHILRAPDELDALSALLDQALEASDLVFLTGGVSVGDFDFGPRAAAHCGVTQVFHGVRQRPAKPLYFGQKDGKYVFGLPGNPASSLTAFYEYGLPALGAMTRLPLRMPAMKVPLASPFRKPAGLTHFLKGLYDGETVTVLGGQESYRLSSFARANCLIQLDEDVTSCPEGEVVEIHLLPAWSGLS